MMKINTIYPMKAAFLSSLIGTAEIIGLVKTVLILQKG